MAFLSWDVCQPAQWNNWPTLLHPTLQFQNLQEKYLAAVVALPALQCSRGLQLSLKPGQHSLHCFGIPKVINSMWMLETIPCLEKMANGVWLNECPDCSVALLLSSWQLHNFIKLDVIKKKVSFIHTAFFNLEDEFDVKPKGKMSYWRFKVISVGKKWLHLQSTQSAIASVKVQQNTSRAQNPVTSSPTARNSQSTLIMLNTEMMFGAETSCASGAVSYRKM